MKLFVILLTLVGSITAASLSRPFLKHLLDKVGRTKRQGRVVGGTTARDGEFPWMVSLQRNGFFGRAHFCAGSVLDATTVLTAAHCIEELKPIGVWVVGGEYQLDVVSGFEQEFKANQLILHENYDNSLLKNDIGLIRINNSFLFNDKLKAAKLPAVGYFTRPETPTTVAGWGSTQEGGTLSNILLKAVVPVVSDQDCRKVYGAELIDDSMLCAGYTSGGLDSCQGDSGGQLMIQDETLVGIVSWGEGCGLPNYPGVYTEVSAFIPWINQKLASK